MHCSGRTASQCLGIALNSCEIHKAYKRYIWPQDELLFTWLATCYTAWQHMTVSCSHQICFLHLAALSGDHCIDPCSPEASLMYCESNDMQYFYTIHISCPGMSLYLDLICISVRGTTSALQYCQACCRLDICSPLSSLHSSRPAYWLLSLIISI